MQSLSWLQKSYNYGGVASSDANKMAVIAGLSLSNACTGVLADLGALVQPKTLIPHRG